MELKEKIELFLQTQEKTIKDLAEYIEESEEDLNRVLDGSTVEIRILEKISKALRIPLFSFFHQEEFNKKEEIPYYNNKLPDTELTAYIKDQRNTLKKEIELLKITLKEKEDMLKGLDK